MWDLAAGWVKFESHDESRRRRIAVSANRRLPAMWTLVLCFLLAVGGGSASANPVESRTIAITFDDVPGVAVLGDCDRAAILSLNRRLVETATSLEIPATGLVTESRICTELRNDVLAESYSLWLDAGFELGNHTFSHPDLNRATIEDFKTDIVRGEKVLSRLLATRGERIRYFRYPMLHAGDTPEKKRAIERFLAERNYTNAPVTIDNQEWVFAASYRSALAAGEKAVAECVADAYVPFMEAVTAFFEIRSREVLGYEPPQVLLLHANELNADRLEELAEMLRRRDYRLITLEEALSDPAYRLEANYVGPRGLSWIHRWALERGMELMTEPREPPWVAALNRDFAQESGGAFVCPE